MAIVAISGYLTGFRMKNNDNNYGVIDLLQFGTNEKQSKLIPVLVYDSVIQRGILQNYVDGEIRSISLVVEHIYTSKKDVMWIAHKVIHFGSENEMVVKYEGDNEDDGNRDTTANQ